MFRKQRASPQKQAGKCEWEATPTEWWKVNHPYQNARDHRCSGRSPESAAAAVESNIAALEEANLVKSLSEAELIEYPFLTSGAEPRSYKEAMTRDDARLWQEASQQESGIYVSCLRVGKLLPVAGSIALKRTLMALLSVIRLSWWPRVFPKSPILITLRPSLLWPNLLRCELCYCCC